MRFAIIFNMAHSHKLMCVKCFEFFKMAKVSVANVSIILRKHGRTPSYMKYVFRFKENIPYRTRHPRPLGLLPKGR